MQRRIRPHIDMTPLIDCLFTLLIVFMLAASLHSSAVRVALPKAAAQDRVPARKIIVSMNEHGACFVNGERVELAALTEKLRPLLADSKEATVTFHGDRRIPYDWVFKVRDAALAAGAANLDLAHDREEPSQP